jgi:hypothetical protein
MANMCCVYLCISGDPAQIETLRTLIVDQDENLLVLFPWFDSRGDYGLVNDLEDIADDEESILDFSCKWTPPLEELCSLSKHYPGLTFSGQYEESGNCVYGEYSIQNGTVSDFPLKEEDYLLKFNEEFIEHICNIEQAEYDVKDITERLEQIEDYLYSDLIEKHILAKIKDEHLPLFLNHKWYPDNQETFNKRLKGE